MAYIAEDGSPSHCEIGAGKATDGFHSSKRIGKLAHTHRTRGGAWASLHHTTPRGFIGIPPLLVVRCPPTGIGRTFASHSSCRWELHPSSGGGRSPRWAVRRSRARTWRPRFPNLRRSTRIRSTRPCGQLHCAIDASQHGSPAALSTLQFHAAPW